ncbi:MAG: hypothetical protein JWO69_1541 [Thermoleophilia bacterium]|jgi:hypothetical protein|nr:hypothetical protein [Thermoleophilia bacterium]
MNTITPSRQATPRTSSTPPLLEPRTAGGAEGVGWTGFGLMVGGGMTAIIGNGEPRLSAAAKMMMTRGGGAAVSVGGVMALGALIFGGGGGNSSSCFEDSRGDLC